MAASAIYQDGWRTSELVGGNQSVPVHEYAYVTTISGVYFQFRIRESDLAGKDDAAASLIVASRANELADELEALISLPAISFISYSQPANQAGQLVDTLTFYVTSTSGRTQDQFERPFALQNMGTVIAREAAALRARLDAIEAA